MTSAAARGRGGRPHPEMLQKPHLHETFFSLKNVRQRPVSVATEFMMESDWDDDEILSDIEDGENSPRLSLNSSGQPSITTLSSYEEAQTPRSSEARTGFHVETDSLKQVEGPRGPHLFRSSTLSAQSIEFQNALSLSPITPKTATPGTAFQLPIALDLTPLPGKKRESGPFRFTNAELDTCDLADWTPEMVAQHMLTAGVEVQVAEKFVENDITGAILMTLKFEDLKELDIPSFGTRTKIWNEIHVMLNVRAESPDPETPIEDEPDREVRKERRARVRDETAEMGSQPRRKPSRRKFKAAAHEDIISPLESVSIVGIEQMMPKPHYCKKGENCPKYKRNQRMLEAFKKDHPFVDMDKGGVIMVAGDPGNPLTAPAINMEDLFRPVSDAIPSVVASSDIMGTDGMPPLQYLQEATLRNIQSQDPQDNVRQFLNFQHQISGNGSSEVPPTPPFELFPQPQQRPAAHDGLRGLPKLSIPGQQVRPIPNPAASAGGMLRPQADLNSAGGRNRLSAGSTPEQTPTAPYRFGTPFSDMDVPVTAVPLGPVARDVSQSVPPDMTFRPQTTNNQPPRSMSRASARRPSFPVLPALDENRVAAVPPQRHSPVTQPRTGGIFSQQRPLQPPPRVQYPWTTERTAFEKAIAPAAGSTVSLSGTSSSITGPTASSTPTSSSKVGMSKDAEGITYQGPMKKRRTKMLRHEWHENYFTLKGTRLAMHKDANDIGRTLEYVDIDDYAIACSSLASSKLNAAFKAMHIRRGSGDGRNDVGAFSFQLIPQDARGGVKLLRRHESSISGGSGANPPEGVNGNGKTHHFAVKTRDERIDWMRELMLARAMKQKGEGFEVSVNGNMI